MPVNAIPYHKNFDWKTMIKFFEVEVTTEIAAVKQLFTNALIIINNKTRIYFDLLIFKLFRCIPMIWLFQEFCDISGLI